VSGDETVPRDIWAALAAMTRRLDDLAAGLARLHPAEEPTAPPGEPLDEAGRARLARLESLLALAPGLGREPGLWLAVDRVIHGARAECAAVFVARPGGDLETAVHRGFSRDPGVVTLGEGIVARAFLERETIRAAAAHQAGDRLLREQGLSHALAVPIRLGDQAPGGVLFAGRRRPAAFDEEALETVTLVADRVALLFASVAALEAPPRPAPALGADLDLARTAGTVAREAARLLGAPRVVVLVPEEGRLSLAGGVGVVAGAVPPDPAGGAIAAALLSGQLWVATDEAGDEALGELLGVPARLVVPLAVGGHAVALLVAGGPNALAPSALGELTSPAAAAIRNARLYTETVAALADVRGPSRPMEPPPPSPVRDFAGLLAVVLSRIALVRDRVADPGVARELGVAEEAAWRAAEAVRGFLGFGPGHRAAALLPLDLGTAIRAAVEQAERRWAGRAGPRPTVTLDLEPLPPVRGSADDLREAIDHLLENAAEAVAGDGPIRVCARWDGGRRVDMTVEDGGPGMDETVQARALEPFFSTRGAGRLGLGLPVAQAVVAQHRGTLDLVSAPGRGTTVRLTFPIAAGLRTGAGDAEGGPARILVVEDEGPVREALVALLTQQGHVVLAAADGREGIAVAQREPLDLVFTDLAVPEASGLEVGRALKRIRPGTPVVLITAWPGRLDPATLEEAGIDRVIEKPVGAPEVLAALEATLAVRRATRP